MQLPPWGEHDVLVSHDVAAPMRDGVLLWADRGLLDQTPGAYTTENTAGLGVSPVRVPDTNHYSILAGPGASVVA